ncbi:MarR family transcriptional regulator [Tersicoccus sp. MR15.9]|uniref:MarR family winged helix-turn-helix transcriptional regulator n=1 Tax=Tersicoccus mangrovi TaxID=3121635 RepID=UPI002FE5AAB0
MPPSDPAPNEPAPVDPAPSDPAPADAVADRQAARSGLRAADRAWESLFRAQVEVMRHLLADDAFATLSMREYDVLYNLSRDGGWVRQHELNAHLLISQPSLSRMLDRLADRGLVERRRASDDARGVQIRLTDDGEATQRQVGRVHLRTIGRLFSGALTREEMDALTVLTDRLRAGLPGPDGPDRRD